MDQSLPRSDSLDCAFSDGSSHLCCWFGSYCSGVDLASPKAFKGILVSAYRTCDSDSLDGARMGVNQLALWGISLVESGPSAFG